MQHNEKMLMEKFQMFFRKYSQWKQRNILSKNHTVQVTFEKKTLLLIAFNIFDVMIARQIL